MKSLLIIGVGGHGKVVAETAIDCGYTKIDFIDDNNASAIGKVSDLEKFRDCYQDAFVGIGNNAVRDQMIGRLFELGYHVPVLIHPTAYVSRSAVLSAGTIVEPKAIVNTAVCVERGCIISVGAVIDHNARIGKASHVDAGAVVSAGGNVEDYSEIGSGEVVPGYQMTAAAEKEKTENE